MLLNNSWIEEEVTIEIRKYFELNDNDNTLQGAVKTTLKGENVCINKEERLKIII